MKWYDIFRAGNYPQGNFTIHDLDQIVANYNSDSEDFDEAPLVLGHPKNSDPAYGWIDKIRRSGDTLQAVFKEVDEQLKQFVEQGKYKKVSVRLAKHPEKGWVLKHLGFLGAVPPGVKGLKPIQFSEETESVSMDLDFSEGSEKKVTPEELEKALADQKKIIEKDFAEKENALKSQLIATKQELRRGKLEKFMSDHQEKLPPAVRSGMLEFMEQLATVETAVEFSEANKPIKKAPLEFFQDFISKLPNFITLGTETIKTGGGKKHADFLGNVDEEEMELHQKTIAFAEKNNCAYEVALQKVLQQG